MMERHRNAAASCPTDHTHTARAHMHTTYIHLTVGFFCCITPPLSDFMHARSCAAAWVVAVDLQDGAVQKQRVIQGHTLALLHANGQLQVGRVLRALCACFML